MALGIKRRIVSHPRRVLAEKALGHALGFTGKNPDKNARYFLGAIDHITKGEKQGSIRDWIHQWMGEGMP